MVKYCNSGYTLLFLVEGLIFLPYQVVYTVYLLSNILSLVFVKFEYKIRQIYVYIYIYIYIYEYDYVYVCLLRLWIDRIFDSRISLITYFLVLSVVNHYNFEELKVQWWSMSFGGDYLFANIFWQSNVITSGFLVQQWKYFFVYFELNVITSLLLSKNIKSIN